MYIEDDANKEMIDRQLNIHPIMYHIFTIYVHQVLCECKYMKMWKSQIYIYAPVGHVIFLTLPYNNSISPFLLLPQNPHIHLSLFSAKSMTSFSLIVITLIYSSMILINIHWFLISITCKTGRQTRTIASCKNNNNNNKILRYENN